MLIRDTSGSVSDTELEQDTSEVVGIATGMGIRRRDLRIMDVDAAVQHTADYTGAAARTRVHGRVEPILRVGITAALDLRPRPHAIVVFTGGETPWPDARPAVPLIVCLVGSTAEAAADRVPDWAVTVVSVIRTERIDLAQKDLSKKQTRLDESSRQTVCGVDVVRRKRRDQQVPSRLSRIVNVLTGWIGGRFIISCPLRGTTSRRSGTGHLPPASSRDQ